MTKYLFVLSPPFSGSTVLWRLLATSPNVSVFPKEGQFLDGVRDIMRNEPWNTDRKLPWEAIKTKWDSAWDQSKSILVEKSPPNLSRALEIEKVFVPSYFIAMIQNPYSTCEGIIRRGSSLAEGMEGAAKFWVRCAQYQRRNIQELSRVIRFTYEAFTDNPLLICEQLTDFVPELQQLDMNTSFKARSITGYGPQKIVNFSQMKFNLLSAKDISAINNTLKEYPDLMEFFGYELMYPTIGHNIRRYRIMISVSATKAMRRVENFRRRTFSRIRRVLPAGLRGI